MKLTDIIAAGLTATLLSTGVAYAQTAPADIQIVVKNEMVAQMPEVMALVEALKADGYTYIEIRRTMLGRAKIIAQGPAGEREIVMSTTTGEVMRDATHGTDHMEMGDGSHDDMDQGAHDDKEDHDGGMGDENHDGGMGGSTGGGMGTGMDGS